MKKFFFSLIILFLCAASAFSQVKQKLDEQITKSVLKNLPEWKAENSPNPFKIAPGTYSPVIEARWKKGKRRAEIRIEALESPNINKKFDWLHPFLIRGVIPPNRKVENLGDSAHLVETASRVEIAFYKANIYAVLNVNFPDTRVDKKPPYYYARAPKEEVETALKFARVIADAIDGEKNFSPCFNNFYRALLPAAKTLEEELSAAVLGGETERVKSLVSQNINPNHIFPDGNTALHLAVRQGCFETVKTLIAAKVNVNAKNGKGATPLMLAANFGDLELVKLLTDSGADVNAENNQGETALFKLISRSNSSEAAELVKLLIARGADVNRKTRKKETAVGYLESKKPFYLNDANTLKNISDIIKLLKDAGATE